MSQSSRIYFDCHWCGSVLSSDGGMPSLCYCQTCNTKFYPSQALNARSTPERQTGILSWFGIGRRIAKSYREQLEDSLAHHEYMEQASVLMQDSMKAEYHRAKTAEIRAEIRRYF